MTQDRQVDDAVAVDVERVGSRDRRQVGRRVGQAGEAEGAADLTLVAEQGSRLAAAGKVKVGPAVVVAIERRRAATDEVRELAVVGVRQSGRLGLLDEAGRGHGRRRRPTAEHRRDGQCRDHDGRCSHHGDHDRDRQPDRTAAGTSFGAGRHRGIEAQQSGLLDDGLARASCSGADWTRPGGCPRASRLWDVSGTRSIAGGRRRPPR